MFSKPDVVKKKLSQEGSFIDVTTCKKIKWTAAKDKKMYFNMGLGLCCPKTISEKEWKKYQTLFRKEPSLTFDPYDYFDWAEDQKIKYVKNKNGHKDYIISLSNK